MKKIIAILLCLVTLGSFCVTACAVTQTEAPTEFELEIDVEKRYTNISEMDDYHKTFLDVETEEEETKESRKMIYITILCVLLVVAVVILVVSLKRVPPAEDEEAVGDISASMGENIEGSTEATEDKDAED